MRLRLRIPDKGIHIGTIVQTHQLQSGWVIRRDASSRPCIYVKPNLIRMEVDGSFEQLSTPGPYDWEFLGVVSEIHTAELPQEIVT